jgi:hypothetical protein
MEHIPVQEDRSGKQMETGARRRLQRKGGPRFPKIGKQKHACYIIITLTWQERCDESQIVLSFWDSLRYRISG